jgi:hypothetical protein
MLHKCRDGNEFRNANPPQRQDPQGIAALAEAAGAAGLEDGGRGWDRTSDPLDVNEVLSR